MMPEKKIIKDTKEHMQKTLEFVEHEMTKIRTGVANIALVEEIYVDYYGVKTPLSQVAVINIPDPRTLLIKPWDKTMLKPIEKAILASDLGITPTNDGASIRLSFPQPTTERKKQLVKIAKEKAEEGKVAIRQIRKDMLKELKVLELPEDDERKTEDEIQKVTNEFVKKMAEVFEKKEKEILEV
jgi:ribosome recycling factor